MATRQETIDFILDQVAGAGAGAGGARARKMFGEYALYLDGKVVALVCGDQLFVKTTEPGRAFLGDRYEEGCPYPGQSHGCISAKRCSMTEPGSPNSSV